VTSRLLASRATILAALEAGGVNSSTSGKWSAPCVLVEPGDPWAGVDLSLGRRRTGRWRLTAIAGRTDTDGAIEKLAELVDVVDVALLAVQGLELPTWSRTSDTTVDGAAYSACTATVQLITPRPEEVLP
jgi:hypothetical protein